MGLRISLATVIVFGFALWGFLALAGWLISRYEGKSEGSSALPGGSRLFRDLRPFEDLLAEFVAHSEELVSALGVLVTCDMPLSLARIVHEIRIARNGPINSGVAANMTGASLCILYLAGLVKFKRGQFVATEVGREVHRRTQQPHVSRKSARYLYHSVDRIYRSNTTPTKKPVKMNNRNIMMTPADHEELEAVVMSTGKVSGRAQAELRSLQNELRRATILPVDKIPADVITMNSRAELIDLESNERMEFTLVLPSDADIDAGKISVLAPLGTAMLGYRVGDEFEWPVPYGARRLRVEKVHFQPEANLKQAA